jgi:DNA-binding transcriptional LysR family regulator
MATLDNFRLVVFMKVAEHLSFRKAAEELYLTQPAVSLQIKALESELGTLLFDRSGTHAKLTDAGAVLLKYVRQSSAILLKARNDIGKLGGNEAGELNLGASTTIAQYVLPRLLSEFCKSRPRVHTTLISGNSESIVDAIEKQRIALGFIEGPPRNRDVQAVPFLQDELVLIVPASHEWVEQSSIALRDLMQAPLLMRERGSGTRRIIEMAFERHRIKRSSLRIAMELDSTEAIKSAVEAGLGVGFVSRWAIAKDNRLGPAFRIVELKGVRFLRQFLAVSAKSPEDDGLAVEFRDFVLAKTSSQRIALSEKKDRSASTDKYF